MSVITLFSGSYCHGEEVAQKLVERLGFLPVDDQTLVNETAKRFRMDADRILRAMTGKASVFNKFTHEKERSLAHLKVVLADLMQEDRFLYHGFAAHLIPRSISHALKVCTIADIKYRSATAARQENISERDAQKRIYKDDESRVLWIEHLFGHKDPWDTSLYDMMIPMDKTDEGSAVKVVIENLGKSALKVTEASRRAVEDFILASRVDLQLAMEGHGLCASASDGRVRVTINKHVLMLSSLEEELKRIVSKVPGVKSVETAVGPGYYKTDIYRKYDFELALPSKVLLVDDERDFVQTLSERLQMRDMGSAVAYDGEEALSVIDEEEPEVVVLDLKMPGVDGIEVLRRVKRDHPDVEVVVLTGHGSKEIESLCLELGACAYLEKPVDLETLTQTMKQAYQRIKEKKLRE